MANEEIYLEINVKNNLFVSLLSCFADNLVKILGALDIDLIDIGNVYGDDVVGDYLFKIISNIYELFYLDSPSFFENQKSIEDVSAYLRENFSFRFIVGSEVQCGGKSELLYIPLTGVNKYSFFIV